MAHHCLGASPVLRVILGDQLSLDLSALADLDPGRDVVLMMEVAEEGSHVPHHKQKIVLVLSAMRHFAEVLRQRGVTIPFIMYSSTATPTQRQDIKRRGAMDCTDDPQELVRLVNQAILISLSRDTD